VDFILIKAKTKMREVPLLHFEVDERGSTPAKAIIISNLSMDSF